MKTNTASLSPETVGRKYQTVRYSVHSRRMGSNDGSWAGGGARYKTLEEAQAHIEKCGQQFQHIGGGLVLDTGTATELYEYRIVKSVCENEVVWTGERMV